MSRTTGLIEFGCPGCGLPCVLDQDRKTLKHQLPTCAVYEKTKGQAFLELVHQVTKPPAGMILVKQ